MFLSEFNRILFFFSCSGYGIAAQALTAIIRAYDGRGPVTILSSNILQILGLSSPDELIGYIFQHNTIVIWTLINCGLLFLKLKTLTAKHDARRILNLRYRSANGWDHLALFLHLTLFFHKTKYGKRKKTSSVLYPYLFIALVLHGSWLMLWHDMFVEIHCQYVSCLSNILTRKH